MHPNLIYHWARGEYEAAYTIYYTMARYSAFPLLLGTAFLGVFGSDFLRLGIGARFLSVSWWFRADIVLFFLLAAQVPRALHSISWQLLQASNKQHALSVLIGVEAMCNLGLAFALVRHGTVGLAIAVFIPMSISQGIVLPILLRRLVGVSMRRYLLEGIGRPLIVAATVAALGAVLHRWIPPAGWPWLILDGRSDGDGGVCPWRDVCPATRGPRVPDRENRSDHATQDGDCLHITRCSLVRKLVGFGAAWQGVETRSHR